MNNEKLLTTIGVIAILGAIYFLRDYIAYTLLLIALGIMAI
jgi:hypothetical protein